MTKRTAAVAGAGIAGLAAAAALAQRGFDVRVFERTEDPREFGAGGGVSAPPTSPSASASAEAAG